MIELSAVDLFFASPTARPSNLLLVFDGPVPHDLLERSFAQLVALYPPLASTLHAPNAHRLYLRQRDQPPFGVLDVEILPTDPLAYLPVFEPVRNVPGEPLARFVHVRSPTASALIVSFSHVLGDAAACFDLLMAWVTLARGRTPKPPHLERNVFRELFGTFGSATGSLVDAGLQSARKLPPITASDVVGIQTRVFTRAWLDEQRAERPVSRFSLIAGAIWEDLARETDGTAALAVPVDLRRLLPELPRRYFGNALRPAVCRAPAEEVLALSPVQRAGRVEDAIHAVDRASLARDHQLVDALVRTTGLQALADQRVTGADTVLVSDISYAPLGLLTFAGARCTKLQPISLYARSVAVLPHAEGFQTLRAQLRAPA